MVAAHAGKLGHPNEAINALRGSRRGKWKTGESASLTSTMYHFTAEAFTFTFRSLKTIYPKLFAIFSRHFLLASLNQ